MDRNKKRKYNKYWNLAKRTVFSITEDTDTLYSDEDSGSDHLDSARINVDSHLLEADNFHDDRTVVQPNCSSTSNDSRTDDWEGEEFHWPSIDDHVQLLSDSESEDGMETNGGVPLAEALASWVNEFQIKHNATDSLLKLLKTYGHESLPTTARTLLKTSREVHIEMKSGMEYVNLGMQEELLKTFKKYPFEDRENVDVLEISLNIDGVPLFKSTKKSTWPVLCAIHMKPVTVFPVALMPWMGNKWS